METSALSVFTARPYGWAGGLLYLCQGQAEQAPFPVLPMP